VKPCSAGNSKRQIPKGQKNGAIKRKLSLKNPAAPSFRPFGFSFGIGFWKFGILAIGIYPAFSAMNPH